MRAEPHAQAATEVATAGAVATPLDHPLRGLPHPYDKLHPAMYLAELIGTAVLIFVGLSVVVALWGQGAPLASLPLSPPARRALNGFLFGSVGAAIAFSPMGRISGAHINPAVTLAFWLEDKIKWRDALGYLVAQCLGAALGGAGLLLWGPIGASNGFGASLPETGVSVVWPVLGEALCTFLLVACIFVLVAHQSTRWYTPLCNPPLFCLLVWLEAPLSGASANPARSLGPALVSGLWHGQWVYWIGPGLGAALAVAVLRLDLLGRHRPHEARLFHFRHHPAGEGGAS